jgi:putative transposase
MKKHEQTFCIVNMASLLGVSRSGYYDWRVKKVSQRKLETIKLDSQIRELFSLHKKRYGAPRIAAELQAKGIKVSRQRVARRMKELGLRAQGKRKFRVTTDSKHTLPVAANLLQRDFASYQANQKWVGDITYVHTDEGWLYLAVVIDLYSRKVIGWSMSTRIDAKLACDALMMALQARYFPKGVIVHTDRGIQYCSAAYQSIIRWYGLVCSMSRVRDCWDNAVAESFFHTLKTELIYVNRYVTPEEARQSIFHYIEMYYNRVRRHSTIGSLAPCVFEEQYKFVA